MGCCKCESLENFVHHLTIQEPEWTHIYKTNNRVEWGVMLILLRDKIFGGSPYQFITQVNQHTGVFQMVCNYDVGFSLMYDDSLN